MPNLKIYVDETIYPTLRTALVDALPPLRDVLCSGLKVPVSACQFAVIPVLAMPDLPGINMEIQILQRAERTSAVLTELCVRLRATLEGATGAHVAVRMGTIDPETYVTLK
ncbi:hypothetical protein [Phaeovulum sp. W22_SRMD_FR3]|uniref:hypothetical protein n=1 Tax=Phaeovulum sp. W22_SRMD_FR3 TaxID=3240274 RepID=UPI003F9D62C5